MPLEVSFDSTEVIHMINNGHLCYDPFISECMCSMRRTDSSIVKHRYREQNCVADLLAKEESRESLFEKTNIMVVPPIFAMDAVWANIFETMFCKNGDCNLDHYMVNYDNFTGSSSTASIVM